MSEPTIPHKVPFTPYQWRLFFFLSVATFFEGFDMFALTQILPSLTREWRLSAPELGLLAAATNAGTMLAYFLVRSADRWGRKSVLSVTIVGYTIASLMTAFAQGPVTFALLQCVARIFLIGEWTTAMVYASEEFPADRRGTVVGTIQAVASVGAIVCAGVVPFLLKTSLGWRSIYVVGALPLIAIAFARRTLRESSRFEKVKAEGELKRQPLLALLKGPHAKRLLQLGLIWSCTYVCTQNTVTFFKQFVVNERHWSDAQVGKVISLAALISMPLVFGAGKLLDGLGRRRSAVVVYFALVFGCLGAFTLTQTVPLTIALVLNVFAQSAVLALLNAYTGELFPTHVRGDAFAWANNILGRIGYVLSPIVLGRMAQSVGWGPAIASTAGFAAIALVLILLWLPETRGLELEQIAAETH
ncbi:MAG: MFS transporter [Deltaproteobacteria bacterium]|nr:MFS transporter [Deltaproteobacteria bacterium]